MDLTDVGAEYSRVRAEMEAMRASEPREPIIATDPSGAVTASLAEDSLASLEVDRGWKSMADSDWRLRP